MPVFFRFEGETKEGVSVDDDDVESQLSSYASVMGWKEGRGKEETESSHPALGSTLSQSRRNVLPLPERIRLREGLWEHPDLVVEEL